MVQEELLRVLQNIKLEGFNLSSSLRSLNIQKNKVFISLSVSNPTLQFKNKIKTIIENKISDQFPNSTTELNFLLDKNEQKSTKSSINNIIAIASGKGGVGKSTVASNLAIALKNQGYNVGLIDADIYGPSIPLMFDAENERPKSININNKSLMSPVISYGVKIMSIGFFSNPNDAIIFRGPMATKALKQMIDHTHWDDLDYLLIDLPPGTGDIHLSIVQSLSLTGSIVVTTPQPVSLIDAKKAISMFKKKEINVPVVGLVENMSCLFIDNQKHYIFGKDGGKALAQNEGVPLLAQIPLEQTIREAGDVGRPAALQNSIVSKVFDNLAEKIKDIIDKRNIELPPTKKVKITHNRGCN